MLCFELLAGLLAPVVAPNNSIVVRFASMIPTDNSLALIGHPNSSQFIHLKSRIVLNRIGDSYLNAEPDILHDFLRIVLEPALGRRDLLVLNEVLAHQFALRGVYGELGGSCGLVQ